MTKETKKRLAPLSVRFTADELELIEQAAILAGEQKSTFVKKTVLGHKLVRRRNIGKLTIKDREALLRVYHELRKSGLIRTFNTVANVLSKGHSVYTLMEKTTLLNACADIQLLRRLIEKALGISS